MDAGCGVGISKGNNKWIIHLSILIIALISSISGQKSFQGQ
jgi:hypothetical protein